MLTWGAGRPEAEGKGGVLRSPLVSLDGLLANSRSLYLTHFFVCLFLLDGELERHLSTSVSEAYILLIQMDLQPTLSLFSPSHYFTKSFLGSFFSLLALPSLLIITLWNLSYIYSCIFKLTHFRQNISCKFDIKFHVRIPL